MNFGGQGRNRTFGVSGVTDLQSAGFAARHTYPEKGIYISKTKSARFELAYRNHVLAYRTTSCLYLRQVSGHSPNSLVPRFVRVTAIGMRRHGNCSTFLWERILVEDMGIEPMTMA